MWFSAIKLAVSAGSKIYANKQKTKMAMSEAQLMHAWILVVASIYGIKGTQIFKQHGAKK
jgi:hypothetical protein